MSRFIRRPLLGALAVATVAAYVLPAEAATILVDAERSVRSSGNVSSATSQESWSRTERPALEFGPFNAAVSQSRTAGSNAASSQATQNSQFTTGFMSGSGTARSSVSVNEPRTDFFFFENSSDATSGLSITFRVSTPTYFDLTGSLLVDVSPDQSFSNAASLNFSRQNNFSGPTFNFSFGGNASADFTQNILLGGLLDPGTYLLSVSANSNSRTFSQTATVASLAAFDFRLLLTNTPVALGTSAAVPLPAGAWLLLTAVAAFGRRWLLPKRP